MRSHVQPAHTARPAGLIAAVKRFAAVHVSSRLYLHGSKAQTSTERVLHTDFYHNAPSVPCPLLLEDVVGLAGLPLLCCDVHMSLLRSP